MNISCWSKGLRDVVTAQDDLGQAVDLDMEGRIQRTLWRINRLDGKVKEMQ